MSSAEGAVAATRDARQIIALGGGGFSYGEPALDRYILEQARRPNPAVTFVGTASGDSDRYLAKFYAAFAKLECRPSHLPFFSRTPDLGAHLEAQDVVYVGGGNTRSLLAVWRDHGLPELLREAWASGTVLTGISAGAICWFDQGLTDSDASGLGPLPGLGFLPGSCCPHYDGECERRPRYHELIASRSIPAGIAIDDGVAVHFTGTEPHRVVSERAKANAYTVEFEGGSVREETLSVERIDLG